MSSEPWWLERVDRLLAPIELSALAAGPLWHLSERLQFIRENVEPALLQLDFDSLPRAEGMWSSFNLREAAVLETLALVVARVARAMREGELGPDSFRRGWEGLGFVSNAEGGGTPADDYLDAISQVSRLTLEDPRPAFGMPNMSSRAGRIADFIEVTRPGGDDVVLDLGSGSGKFALTVAASTFTKVRGVELGPSYVAKARRSAEFLGLVNLDFVHADVRDVELAQGTIFYLYYPFHGEVAQSVAETLGRLGREKEITVYLSGPGLGFGEHFLAQVESGALSLSERRGEFSEVLVLRSARA